MGVLAATPKDSRVLWLMMSAAHHFIIFAQLQIVTLKLLDSGFYIRYTKLQLWSDTRKITSPEVEAKNTAMPHAREDHPAMQKTENAANALRSMPLVGTWDTVMRSAARARG